MTRIVALSDTHGLHQNVKVPDGDVLIHAGDWMNSGRHIQEALNFSQWWNRLPHKHKILIGGNHDIYLQIAPKMVLPLFENTQYLEDSSTEIDGVTFWGSPWSPEFMSWAFMYIRGKGNIYWDKIPNGIDVLVTHGPPKGTLDSSEEWGPGLGCEELAKRVSEVKPKVHIFGHIHYSHGVDGISRNVSICDENYRPFNEPHIIDLP